MTHAKVEPFGESQSWALLSNSLHSSPPADLPEGLVGFTEYRGINDVACPCCLSFTTQARQPAVRRALCGEDLSVGRIIVEGLTGASSSLWKKVEAAASKNS